MHIFHSAEVDKAAYPSLAATSDVAEKVLEAALASSPLHDLEIEILYVPIVMGPEGRTRYKARSRLQLKKRTYNCSPQLEIEPFLTGTSQERFAEYIRGLQECGPALAKLGATVEQVAAFSKVLDDVMVVLAQTDDPFPPGSPLPNWFNTTLGTGTW